MRAKQSGMYFCTTQATIQLVKLIVNLRGVNQYDAMWFW